MDKAPMMAAVAGLVGWPMIDPSDLQSIERQPRKRRRSGGNKYHVPKARARVRRKMAAASRRENRAAQ